MGTLFGLEDFGLILPALVKLGTREVTLHAYLRPFRAERLFRFPPAERVARIRDWYERRAAEAARRWPVAEFSVLRSPRPYGIASTLPAAKIRDVLRIAAIESVWLDSVQGRRKRERKPEIRWFTVQAQFAIQVEGQTTGSQTVEDRFVAVRATSFDDAIKRLRGEFRAYARPYLSSDGEMVRWAFERVIDVYDTGEEELDGPSVEVFSRLRRRRMRPELVWRPKRG